MSIIKNLTQRIDEETKLLDSYSKQAKALAESFPVARLGLYENYTMNQQNVTVNKGDLILDPQSKSVFVATGEVANGDKPVVQNRYKRRALEPEFVTVGAQVADPVVRKAAGRLATEHPTRRVLVYGELPKKTVGEAVTNLDDNPLPASDPGIPAQMKKDGVPGPRAGEGAPKSSVKIDPNQQETFLKQGGKFKKHKKGNADAGNPNTSKED